MGVAALLEDHAAIRGFVPKPHRFDFLTDPAANPPQISLCVCFSLSVSYIHITALQLPPMHEAPLPVAQASAGCSSGCASIKSPSWTQQLLHP